jgi:hypothetical protein
MKKYVTGIAISFTGILLLLQPVMAAGEWSKIKEGSGIKLYERAVPGTELMEYMAVGPIDEKMEVIGEVLRDIPSYNKWLTDCYGAQIEKKYDKNTFVMYMVLKPPVIEERDIVLKDKTVYDYDGGKALITFTCTDEIKIPLEQNRTRVTIMEGSFAMEYLGRNRTKFVYRLKVDPAGSIPKKVAYGVMKSYPFDSLKDLRKMMGNKKYAEAVKGSEEEKQINLRATNEGTVRRILTARLSRFARNPGAMAAVIAADRDGIKSIMTSGGNYADVEKATIDLAIKYAEKAIADKSVAEKIKSNKKLVADLIDMVVTDCGVTGDTIESIAARYGN